MHVICPHCQNAIEFVDATPRDEILCPSCGSTFRLETSRTTQGADGTSEPRRLGKFELHGAVGRGGFGTVFKGYDPELDRTVAVKVPRAGQLGDAEDLDRFLREARSVAQLSHPSIVPIHEVGQTDGVPYLVSQFVEGMTLADLLTGRGLSLRESAELIAPARERRA